MIFDWITGGSIWRPLGAILIAVVLMTVALGGLTGLLVEEAKADLAATESDTEEWAKENDCKITESFVGLLSKYTCADGSSHWKVGT